MQYAIIGSGAIGSALARRFARRGIDVGVATSKGPDAVTELVADIGPEIVPTEIFDAVHAEMVLLAVPFDAVEALVGQVSDWGRRIVVDATNAINYSTFGPADLGGRPSSELVQEWARGSRVVKAFGSTWARVLGRDPGDAGNGRRVQFLAGNHQDANDEVAAVAARLGFEPIDLGRLDAGGLLIQFGGALTSRSLVSEPIAGNGPPEMDVAEDAARS